VQVGAKSGSTAFVRMKLVLDKGSHTEDTYLGMLILSALCVLSAAELSLAQFYNFLRQMEKAKANLESFS
jgi:hypothetical protein